MSALTWDEVGVVDWVPLSDIRELPPLPAAEQGAEHLDPGLRA